MIEMPEEKEKKDSTEKPREVKAVPVVLAKLEPWKEKTLKDKTKVLVRPKKRTDGTPIEYGPGYERWLRLENIRRKAAGELLIE